MRFNTKKQGSKLLSILLALMLILGATPLNFIAPNEAYGASVDGAQDTALGAPAENLATSNESDAAKGKDGATDKLGEMSFAEILALYEEEAGDAEQENGSIESTDVLDEVSDTNNEVSYITPMNALIQLLNNDLKVMNAYINNLWLPQNGSATNYQVVSRGNLIRYEIKFNISEGVGQPGSIVSVLPGGLVYIAGSEVNTKGSTFTQDGQICTWSWDEIPAGDLVVSVVAEVNPTIENQFVNYAILSFDEKSIPSNSTYHRVAPRFLTSTKKVIDESGDGLASPGESLKYTISIFNYGEGAAQRVFVRDQLNELIRYIDDPGNNEVTINNDGLISSIKVADLMEGYYIQKIDRAKTVTLTFDVKVKDDLDANTERVLSNRVSVGEVLLPATEIETIDVYKNANKKNFAGNGDVLTYTVSFMMPGNVSKYEAMKIVDASPNELVYVADSAKLKIGDQAAAAVQLESMNGELYYELSGDTLKNAAGQLVELSLDLKVEGSLSDFIVNEGKLFFKFTGAEYPDVPSCIDYEVITLAIGPPTEVTDLPGDKKIALLWSDPDYAVVDYYEIKINDFDWMKIALDELTYDPEAGKWYLLFTELPDESKSSFVNGVEYTFLIRAVSVNGLEGAAYEVKSTPDPIGNIGGKNADLLTVHDNNVKPLSGWVVDSLTGLGLSALNPFKETISLPLEIEYASIHRNNIGVAEDATFEMYSDASFTNQRNTIYRLSGSDWLDVTVYIKVISGNQENHRGTRPGT